MLLVAILGLFLLPPGRAVSFVQAVAVVLLPATSPQDSSNPKAVPDQTVPAPQAPGPASQSCPKKSSPSATLPPDCKPAVAKPKKTQRTQKPVAPSDKPATTEPVKKVVRDGGAYDPPVDLSPLSMEQANQQRKSTDQLLEKSDANLKKISGRQLNANQQDTVTQIRSYIEQANAASKEGDMQRAHNLAVKANLLSTELVGH